jgi:hypothetical protein
MDLFYFYFRMNGTNGTSEVSYSKYKHYKYILLKKKILSLISDCEHFSRFVICHFLHLQVLKSSASLRMHGTHIYTSGLLILKFSWFYYLKKKSIIVLGFSKKIEIIFLPMCKGGLILFRKFITSVISVHY